MGLQPLEFADCLTDSPFFRTKLAEHEQELERTSKFIKQLVHHGRDVYNAAKQLSKAQRIFAKDMMNFKFECIGNQLTDDEIVISKSLSEFGKYIEKIENNREMMIDAAEDCIMKPLERFRRENIGAAKEEKKNFDKHTVKFCQSQERYLNMKASKSNDSAAQEADTQVEFEKKAFYTASMKYVLKLQEIQEKKKFEFVEILLSYMLGWLTFYHEGYVDLEDFRIYENTLRHLLQKTRESFECTRDEANNLLSKMLNENKALKPLDQSGILRGFTKQGYLYLMEKKALGTTSWTKYYCHYKKETKEFYMIFYNQVGGKLLEPEKYTLENCVRRASDTIERRFCFDVTLKEKSGPLTFQALSEEDRRLWLDAMDGKEPTYPMHNLKTEESMLDEIGFNFIRKSIAAIESRGLQEQGLYRVVGVNSKVNNLLKVALDPKKADKVSFEDPSVWETKTITSAIKNYLRSLPEPLMTFRLHDSFIKAAKQESKTLRILDVHKYVHQLPQANFEMLDLLVAHLDRVASKSDLNKMTVANLGVCFGPSLMRPEEETMAAVLDIKFCNIVVEILINNYKEIFKNPPDGADVSESRVLPNTNHSTGKPPLAPGALANQNEPSVRVLAGQTVNHAALTQPSRNYASQPIGPPSSVTTRLKQRPPIQPVTTNIGGVDIQSSTSSSTESLTSAKSSLSPRALSDSGTPRALGSRDGPVGYTSNVSALAARFSINLASNDSTTITVITRYRCVGDNDTELSFEANQMITNVRPSREPGWLEGTLDGKTGIIPENYVQYID
ncbi:unnamed protein product [Candidula unifasciata]|uniref:Rho GTPase-activating protein 26 n=1 Tax=Candidula unifasciata TaxID=100452 RepID=A0A8S3ZZT7_9EUPU|nr:unnamed protein product [Candidula unifasciata]